MGNILIRKAVTEDAEDIQRVARDSWHAAYDSVLGADEVDVTVDSWYDPARLVVDDIEDSDRLLFVAVVDDTIVGFVETIPDTSDDDLAHLYRIYVVSDRWGRGIGRSLLDHVETVLEEQGFGRVQVSVLAENDVGVKFYEATEFHRTATTYNDRYDIREYEYLKRL